LCTSSSKTGVSQGWCFSFCFFHSSRTPDPKFPPPETAEDPLLVSFPHLHQSFPQLSQPSSSPAPLHNKRISSLYSAPLIFLFWDFDRSLSSYCSSPPLRPSSPPCPLTPTSMIDFSKTPIAWRPLRFILPLTSPTSPCFRKINVNCLRSAGLPFFVPLPRLTCPFPSPKIFFHATTFPFQSSCFLFIQFNPAYPQEISRRPLSSLPRQLFHPWFPSRSICVFSGP